MIPVVFAINNIYVKQLCTCIASIIKNSKNKDFEFNILSSDISDENVFIIQNFVNKLSLNKSTLKPVDMKQYIKNMDLEKYMSKREDYTYISTETYFRFFIPEIFTGYNKMLYLDADIIAIDDIAKLYNENIDECYAGVVQDTVLEANIENKDIKTRVMPEDNYETYFEKKLEKTNKKYFNAGVLLLNLSKIREDDVVSKLWNFADKKTPLEFQDQDILNAIFENNVKYLDYKWNTLKDLNWFANQMQDDKKRKYLLKVYKKPSIFHYVGDNKPWLIHEHNYNYSFIKKWWDYYKLTPYFKKEELSILKHAVWMQKNKRCYKCYLTIRLLNFTLIDIYDDYGRLHIVILNYIRIHKRYKEPKSYTKIKSI